MTIVWAQNGAILEAKLELSSQMPALSINGEIYNFYGAPVYIKENCQVS